MNKALQGSVFGKRFTELCGCNHAFRFDSTIVIVRVWGCTIFFKVSCLRCLLIRLYKIVTWICNVDGVIL